MHAVDCLARHAPPPNVCRPHAQLPCCIIKTFTSCMHSSCRKSGRKHLSASTCHNSMQPTQAPPQGRYHAHATPSSHLALACEKRMFHNACDKCLLVLPQEVCMEDPTHEQPPGAMKRSDCLFLPSTKTRLLMGYCSRHWT